MKLINYTSLREKKTSGDAQHAHLPSCPRKDANTGFGVKFRTQPMIRQIREAHSSKSPKVLEAAKRFPTRKAYGHRFLAEQLRTEPNPNYEMKWKAN